MTDLPSGGRTMSIDTLRGLDVLLMLFVNEVAGVPGAPAFLRHAPGDADGMTITDVVFPAFLFIVGLAIPFALGARRSRGEPPAAVWRHVFGRALALLVIGVLMVNAELDPGRGPLPPAVWNMLMTVAVVMVWAAPAAEDGLRGRQRILRAAGIALLVVLAFAYRGTDPTSILELRPHWWGILGLIGWAYLLVASLYLLVGDRPAVLTGLTALLYCLYLADAAGQAPALVALRPYLGVGWVLGSHGAVVMSGALLGVMLRRHQAESSEPRRFVAQALGYAAGLAAAALLLHTLHALDPAFRYSKLHATAPWCLLSSAFTAAAWAVAYAITDVFGFRRWPRAVILAGENALLAYLMAPFLLSLFEVSAALVGGVNLYEALARNTAVGLVRSAVFAWMVVRLCGVLRENGLRLRL